jgi:protein O-GlcNAc transferase
VRNLRAEAQARGVDPARLVFAPQLDVADHLARLRCADLFLDTLPYNAHTTASDALWAGVPVLTLEGTTFAGRVAASLLHASGLPELITQTPADYEALAQQLAREPERLTVLRRRLVQTRGGALFDTDRLRRHIEAAYMTMWDAWQRAEAPGHFSVAPIGAPTER